MYVTVTLRQNVEAPLSPASPFVVLSWWPTMSDPAPLSLFLESSLRFGVLSSHTVKLSFSGFTGGLDRRFSLKTHSEELVTSQ